jgi:hypothetical protein
MKHIADLLAKHRRNKAEAKEINLDLVRVAVSIGMPQDEAIKTNLSVFFDGYLTGHGHMPTYRKEELNG